MSSRSIEGSRTKGGKSLQRSLHKAMSSVESPVLTTRLAEALLVAGSAPLRA